MIEQKTLKSKDSGLMIIVLVFAIIALLIGGVLRNTENGGSENAPSMIEQNMNALESAQEIKGVLNEHNQNIILEY